MAKKQFKKLTDKVVADLSVTGKAHEVYDCDFPRLWVAVGATGTKTFYVRVQISGKRRKLNLGTHPSTTVVAARKRAAEALDPTSSERDSEALKPCPTVWQIIVETRAEQVALKLAKDVTWDGPYLHAMKVADNVMNKVGHMSFFERKLSDISKRELVRMYKYLGHNFSPSVMQHFRTSMTKMYAKAYEEGYEGVEHNRARDLQDVVVEVRPRKKTRGALSWNGLRLLWFWIEKAVQLCSLSPRIGLAIQIMAYTGLRSGATRQLKHEDLLVMNDWLIVSPERDKQKIRFVDEALPKFIYLTSTMKELLSRIPVPLSRGDDYFFPSRVGRRAGEPISKSSIKFAGFFDKRDNPSLKAGEKGYRQIEIDRFERCLPPKDLRYLVPHELRHTVTTRALDVVRPKGLVSRMIGHKGRFDTLGKDECATIEDIQLVTKGYAHLTFFNDESYREELKQAWLQWDKKFRAELGLDKHAQPQSRLQWPAKNSPPHEPLARGLRAVK
jgi:integrase